MRTRTVVLMLTLVPILNPGWGVGCGESSGGAGDPDATGDGQSGPAGGGQEGQCVGSARPAYELDDTLSCVAQGGDWLYYDDRCTLEGSTCDSYNIPSDDIAYQRGGCEQRIGCAWQYPDGRLEVSAEASGTCSGTLTPCTQISDRNLCVGRCEWDTDPYGENGSCRDWGGDPDWTENASCEELDNALKSGGIDPVYVAQHCGSLTGCTWANGDGTTETGYVGNGPF